MTRVREGTQQELFATKSKLVLICTSNSGALEEVVAALNVTSKPQRGSQLSLGYR